MARIHYCDIGDYLSREEKLEILADADGLQGIAWQDITPTEKHDWINQRGNVFDSFVSISAKRDKDAETVFDDYSRGVGTNRDAWQYGFSKNNMSANMKRMIEFYNEQVKEFKERKEWDKELIAEDFVSNDPAKISWSNKLRNDLKAGRTYLFEQEKVVQAVYRPFCKQWTYFNTQLISDGLKLRDIAHPKKSATQHRK